MYENISKKKESFPNVRRISLWNTNFIIREGHLTSKKESGGSFLLLLYMTKGGVIPPR